MILPPAGQPSRFAVSLLALLIALASAPAASAQSTVTVKPKEYPRALRNPLMGFRPDLGRRAFEHEYATLARHYIKWNEIENAESDGIDRIRAFCNEKWTGVEAHNVKVIPRVYLHWSKENEKHWPADMKTDDYASDQFKRRVLRLVARLGECWDDDPRVAFVQMGLIGKWGEHHSPDVTPEMQKLLGDAFTKAFKNRKVMVRHPWDFKEYAFGVYWDSFAHQDQMKSHGAGIEKISPRWTSAPIGGEVAYDWGNYKVQPGDSPDDTVSDPAHRRFLVDTIFRLHANHLGWVANYDPKIAKAREGAEEVQRAFGYRFVIDEVTYPAQIQPQKPFAVSFTVRNLGATPLYYNWPVEASLLDPKTKAVLWTGIFKDADTRQWLPGEGWDAAAGAYAERPRAVRVEGRFTIPTSAGGGERLLALAILDPAGNLPCARFSIVSYFTGGRHPVGRIGVGMRPASAEPDPSTFDDPAQDRTLRYALPARR
jgi:hypothetical protein